jgi:hypothetical protein
MIYAEADPGFRWAPMTPRQAEYLRKDAAYSEELGKRLALRSTRPEGAPVLSREAQRAVEIRAGIRQSECPHGHPYNEANTYWHAGIRYCRRCRCDRANRVKKANPEREREKRQARRLRQKLARKIAKAVETQRAG